MWRHHPRTKKAVEFLRAGEIGALRLVVASFSFDIDRSDWRLRPERGGGAMWDVGCYGSTQHAVRRGRTCRHSGGGPLGPV